MIEKHRFERRTRIDLCEGGWSTSSFGWRLFSSRNERSNSVDQSRVSEVSIFEKSSVVGDRMIFASH